MKKNKKIIEQYYDAWMAKDVNKISNFYENSDKFNFNDPIFKNLNYNQTLKMWSIIFKNSSSKQLDATYKIEKIEDNNVWAKTIVKYKFGNNKNKVTNIINCHFVLENMKIIKQTETFDFINWFNQAFNKKQKSRIFYYVVHKIISYKLMKKIKKIN